MLCDRFAYRDVAPPPARSPTKGAATAAASALLTIVYQINVQSFSAVKPHFIYINCSLHTQCFSQLAYLLLDRISVTLRG